MVLIFLLGLIFFLLRSSGSSRHGDGASALFIYEIAPLLETKCLACHGRDPDEIEGGLDLRSRESLLRGGNSGRVVVSPGSPGESYLLEVIRRLDPETAMPPKSRERLSMEEIAHFESWIEGGAPWPDAAERERIKQDPRWKGKGRVSLPIRGALSEDWANRQYRLEDLWAYLPLQRTDVPAGCNPVDFFIDKEVDQAALSKSPPASPARMARRAYLGLTGLPPTYEQLKEYVEDRDSSRFLKLVDHLLAQPSYGEQMARHWLDVVRYADSDGFSNDYIRPNAWRYRDYVIRSFNEDKPYDQFVLEQIAGDELEPDNPEMLIATGFLRMGPWEHTAMSVAKETRQLFLDDVVNSVGETFLSTPLMCAKCHDHKFDPVSSLDYYQVQACFATTQFADRPAPFLAGENQYLMEEEKRRIEWWINETRSEQAKIEAKEEAAMKSWFIRKGRPYLSKKERRTLPEEQKPPRYLGLSNADLGYRKVLQKRLQTLQAELRMFSPLSFSVYNGADKIVNSGRLMPMTDAEDDPLPSTHILQGGSVYAPGASVQPGIIQAIPLLEKAYLEVDTTQLDPEVPKDKDGRRLALARWITHPDHPLTSRSIVNRIWLFHFGQSLAPDPNNFGTANPNPVHTELLDWLAAFLIDHQWSIKSLHRLIMSSNAYQRSTMTGDPGQQTAKDPSNYFFARFEPRRLAAEEIRDAMLFISGELNPEMGGIPVRPEINQEVALQPRHIMGSVAQAYQPNRERDARNRRSIYSLRIRSMEDPFLSVFNQPRTEISCGQRSVSTISPQALALINNEQIRHRALALAVRIETLTTDPDQQIFQAVRNIWLRDPTPPEMTQAREYVDKMTRYHQEQEVPPVSRPVVIKREMFEEMTGEAFEFDEKLDIYEDYQPDLEYFQVQAPTRALADYCIILFNSNEFMYVY